MAFYRKKPVVIEAFCLGKDPIPNWFMDQVSANVIILHGRRGELDCCQIVTLEGVMEGHNGDYILQGIHGEIFPCKADIFTATYERLAE